MAEIIEYIKSWSVLKWVLLVLIAGFIGQFGRMTAEAIVKKIAARRAKKENISAKDPSSGIKPPPAQKDNGLRQDKQEKKRLKTLAKAVKKAAKKK